MIEVQNLSKHYREIRAVDDISFSVKMGDILGFLGRNGAGKTTTMRMVTGYLSPTGGRVLVDGRNVFDDPYLVKRQIGYLPETPPLYLDMTTEVYLRHVSNLKGLAHRYINKEIDRVCSHCGLHGVKRRMLSKLSKGFRQRVGLAQALLGDPKILILDEPTVGLDPTQIREIRGLIQELAREHTVILSTHILGEVQLICNRVIIINSGRIIANDSLKNLSRGEHSTQLKLTLAQRDNKALGFLRSIDGINTVEESNKGRSFELLLDREESEFHAQILQKLVEAGYPVIAFQNMAPTLEEIFLRTVREDFDEETPEDDEDLEDLEDDEDLEDLEDDEEEEAEEADDSDEGDDEEVEAAPAEEDVPAEKETKTAPKPKAEKKTAKQDSKKSKKSNKSKNKKKKKK